MFFSGRAFGLEPRDTRRELEQQREQLASFQPEQQQPEQQEQQLWVPCPLPLACPGRMSGAKPGCVTFAKTVLLWQTNSECARLAGTAGVRNVAGRMRAFFWEAA
jgi:hypothetical protein